MKSSGVPTPEEHYERKSDVLSRLLYAWPHVQELHSTVGDVMTGGTWEDLAQRFARSGELVDLIFKALDGQEVDDEG